MRNCLAAFATAFAFISALTAHSDAPACSCKNLGVLQAELQNAARLRDAFSRMVPLLRSMGNLQSNAELQRFAAGEARKGLKPVPGADETAAVDYDRRGDHVGTDNLAKFTDAQLCARTAESEATLARAVAGAGCKDVGDAIRKHEDFHVETCSRIGYRAYRDMHGADRAQEEVVAYTAQITEYRYAVARALEAADVWLEFQSVGWLGASVQVARKGELHVLSSPTIKNEDGSIELLAQGKGTADFSSIPGMPCRVAGGAHQEVPVTARLLFAQNIKTLIVNIQSDAKMQFGLQCFGASQETTVRWTDPSPVLGISYDLPVADATEKSGPMTPPAATKNWYKIHFCPARSHWPPS